MAVKSLKRVKISAGYMCSPYEESGNQKHSL